VAVVPDSHDFVDGVATSSEANAYIRDPLRFLLNKPLCKVRQTVLQSIPNSVGTAILFDFEDYDNDPSGAGGHSTSVNTSRFTAVYAGWYRLDGGVGWAANATGIRISIWAVNGAALADGQSLVNNAGAALGNKVAARGTEAYLNVGDYVELQAFQTSGAGLNTNVASGEQSSMIVSWDRN
jgi:hypothetical protein